MLCVLWYSLALSFYWRVAGCIRLQQLTGRHGRIPDICDGFKQSKMERYTLAPHGGTTVGGTYR